MERIAQEVAMETTSNSLFKPKRVQTEKEKKLREDEAELKFCCPHMWYVLHVVCTNAAVCSCLLLCRPWSFVTFPVLDLSGPKNPASSGRNGNRPTDTLRRRQKEKVARDSECCDQGWWADPDLSRRSGRNRERDLDGPSPWCCCQGWPFQQNRVEVLGDHAGICCRPGDTLSRNGVGVLRRYMIGFFG